MSAKGLSICRCKDKVRQAIKLRGRKHGGKAVIRGRQKNKKWTVLALLDQIIKRLNDLKIEKKLRMIYIYCVLIPLIITDSVILYTVFEANKNNTNHENASICNIVKNNLKAEFDTAVIITNRIYGSSQINSFLNQHYDSPFEYYNANMEQIGNNWFTSGTAALETKVTLYANNSTLVNGGSVQRLDEHIRSSEWYQFYKSSERDRVLYIYMDTTNAKYFGPRRRISLISNLNFYQYRNCEKLVKVDMDYSYIAKSFIKMKYDAPVYVCHNNRVILSNEKPSDINTRFALFTEWERVAYNEVFSFAGQEIQIYVLRKDKSIVSYIWANMPLILFLLMINIVLPYVFMRIVERSFTERIIGLTEIFQKVEKEPLQLIDYDVSKDEIGILIKYYNQMASRMTDLIQVVYKDKLIEQEANIARQNAELLALRSQINPHFLFNTLESIRMRSLLKEEKETAHMVQQLAIMERRYVDWSKDYIPIAEEMGIVEAYLELQKYRFDKRLSYELEIEEECKAYSVPQLTIVTFVENACVHGVESKATTCWVFVRVFIKDGCLELEIEDTGNGLEEEQVIALKEIMVNADIALLKKKKHVGIINACLRLKMMTKNKVTFDIESEKGVGTMVSIKIPLEALQ